MSHRTLGHRAVPLLPSAASGRTLHHLGLISTNFHCNLSVGRVHWWQSPQYQRRCLAPPETPDLSSPLRSQITLLLHEVNLPSAQCRASFRTIQGRIYTQNLCELAIRMSLRVKGQLPKTKQNGQKMLAVVLRCKMTASNRISGRRRILVSHCIRLEEVNRKYRSRVAKNNRRPVISSMIRVGEAPVGVRRYNAMIQTKCVQSATFLASGRTRSQAVNSTDSLRSPTPVSRQSALTKILTPIKLLSSCVASISASPADELRRIAHPSNTQQCRQLL